MEDRVLHLVWKCVSWKMVFSKLTIMRLLTLILKLLVFTLFSCSTAGRKAQKESKKPSLKK